MEFFAYVNAERQRRGRSVLQVRQELCLASRLQAEHMSKNRYLAYIAPTTGERLADFLTQASWPGATNRVVSSIAGGSSSVFQVFQLLMDDPSTSVLLFDSAVSIEYAGFGFAWERRGGLPDTSWVFAIAFEEQDMGTTGVPSSTVGYPADEEWTRGNSILRVGEAVTGSTWYGFTRAEDYPPTVGHPTISSRRIKLKLRAGDTVQAASRANRRLVTDDTVLSIEIKKGKIPKGLRFSKKSGLLLGKIRSRKGSRAVIRILYKSADRQRLFYREYLMKFRVKR